MKSLFQKFNLLKLKLPRINTVKIKFKSEKIKKKFKISSRLLLLILSLFCVLLIILTSISPSIAKPFKAATSVVFYSYSERHELCWALVF